MPMMERSGLFLVSLPPGPHSTLSQIELDSEGGVGLSQALAGAQASLTGCFPLTPSTAGPTAFPVPTFQDLAGFWDLLQLSIEDVTLRSSWSYSNSRPTAGNSWSLRWGRSLQAKSPRPWEMPFLRECGQGRGSREETLASQGSPGQAMGTLYDHLWVTALCSVPRQNHLITA